MTGRAVAIQGGLAVAALAAAYLTWQRKPELASGEVFVLDITKNELERVRFEDQEIKSWAEVARDKDENGPFVSLRLSGHDSTGVALPAGHPGIPLKVPERLVRGNESATRLYDRFAPWRAMRALGVLDAAKLKDLGLDTTKKRLEVTSRGRKRVFAIAPAPPGGNNPYVRDQEDGRVYVVERQIMTDFQSASTNLVERRLHGFRPEEIDRLVITAGNKRKEFKATRFEEMPGIRLAPIATPDKPDDTAKNWHDRVWNLFPAEMLGKGETPDAGTPVVQIKIEYFARGRSLGWVELAKTVRAESSTDAAKPELALARSEMSLGWAKLPTEGLTLLTEGEKLIGR